MVEEFKKRFPITLNTQQDEAMHTVDGPVLLLAVPGSGKTTVLVARLGYMIYCKGIAPESILTLTYTVAAARDMGERFASFFGEEMAGRLQFRTINSVCLEIIRYASKASGKSARDVFDIAEESERMRILSGIYQKTEHEYPTEADLKDIAMQIAYFKNMMLSDDEIKRKERDSDIHIHTIFKEYNATLYNSRRMDFDDQMVYALAILRSMPQVLEHFQDVYKYICVDEAQDTSKIQHTIIDMLASKSNNLFMVGDEDQSIYGFRAAYPQALLDFEKKHANAKVLLMEENFRSNANIVKRADGYIQINTLRHEKHMRSTRPAASDIRIIDLKSRAAQYSYLAKVAADCKEETAVLYRENEYVIPLVDRLDRDGIDYRIRNADLTFFTHRIVQDVTSIINLSENDKSTEDFMRVYYKIGTYLKKSDAEAICSYAEKKDISIFDAAELIGDLKPYTLSAIRGIRTHLRNMKKEPAEKAIPRIYKFMGYGEYLEKNNVVDDKQFVLKMIAKNVPDPVSLLDRLKYLQEKIRDSSTDKSCKFILSTIHSSKGLEYDNVYLMDVDDGLFPESLPRNIKKPSDDEKAIYEEERRLFYVGATRAKNNLNIFKLPAGSLFIRQLMGEEEKSAPEKKKTASKKDYRPTDYSTGKRKVSKEEIDHFMRELGEGVIVRHKKLGRGVITEISETQIKVLFRDTEKVLDAAIVYKNGLLEVEEL